MNPILLAALLQGDPPKRVRPDTTRAAPYVDPTIQQRHGGLLDSLVAVTGRAPAEIRLGLSSLKRGSTRGDRIQLTDPKRRTLLHEFGHFWANTNARKAMEIADSLRIDPFRRPGEERLADAFASAFDALSRGDTTKMRPDVRVLTRALAKRPPFAKRAPADQP